jgi:hypothetical protein
VKIIQAKYIDKYKVQLFFSDKTECTVDFGDFILDSINPVITQYKDLKKFRKFKIESGNIVWGKDWDLIFPLQELYNGRIKQHRKKYRLPGTSLSSSAEVKEKYRQ